MTLLMTGAGGFLALASALGFLAELLILTSLTRTIPLRMVAAAFMLGGSLIGVSWVCGGLYSLIDPDINSVGRAVWLPIIDETLKLAPIVLLLWRWRATWDWMLGASDLLVFSGALGCGYDWVERAFKNLHASGSLFHAPQLVTLAGLPTVTATNPVQGYWNAGHAVGAAVVGCSLGLALYFRHRRSLAIALAVAGPAVVLMDHIRVNYSAGGGPFTTLLLILTANGCVVLAALVAGAIAAVGIDLFVAYRPASVALRPDLKPRALIGTRDPALALVRLRARCILAYFDYRAAKIKDAQRPQLAAIIAGTLAGLACIALLSHVAGYCSVNDVQSNMPWYGWLPSALAGVGYYYSGGYPGNLAGPGQYGPYGNPWPGDQRPDAPSFGHDPDPDNPRFIGSHGAPVPPNRFINPETGQPYPRPTTLWDAILNPIAASLSTPPDTLPSSKAPPGAGGALGGFKQ
jgi:hypothetical protein